MFSRTIISAAAVGIAVGAFMLTVTDSEAQKIEDFEKFFGDLQSLDQAFRRVC